MNIFHYHPESGLFLGCSTADESPLEPGVWLVPAYATTEQPPEPIENYYVKWCDGWMMEQIPEPIAAPEPEPIPQSPPLDARYLRQQAYMREADPLFFKAQRGEATIESWHEKIAEIRLRHP